MHALILLVAGLAPLAVASAQPQEAAPATESKVVARALNGRLKGAGAVVTTEQLDDLLLWRDARSPIGQRSLQQLLELRVVETLGARAGIVVGDAEIAKRTAELDDEMRGNGLPGGLDELMRQQGVSAEEFRRYLRLSMIHEALTRKALSIPSDRPVTPDQQSLWLQSQLKERGTTMGTFPWTDGPVVTCGDISITRADFGAHIRQETPADQREEACFLILLERAVRARMPELGDAGVEAALDREMARRKTQALADPKFQGASYEQILGARGLSVDAIRRDPAIRAAALAHEAVDRQHDDESLLREYEAERQRFDSVFGEAVEVRILYLNASPRPDDPLRPSFSKVEDKLTAMKEGIQSPEDFTAAVNVHSQDRATRERGGLLGNLARAGNSEDLANLRNAAFAVVDQDPDRCSGKVFGPVRLTNGAALAMLGARVPAPTWDEMRLHVHQDLRRRFLEDTLRRDEMTTSLDGASSQR